MKDSASNSSAEKRVLWEVRQRYQVDQEVPSRRQRSMSLGASADRTNRSLGRTAKPRVKRKKRWFLRFLGLLFATLLISGGVFGYKVISASNKITATDQSILGQLKDLLFTSGEHLQGEQEGRINVLLLAVGGEGHKGQDLADTIMVASIRPQSNDVALLSIPRDLYVQVPGEEYYAKINSIHAYGESREKDSGPDTLRETVEDITGLPIHYYARVDFTGFKSVVDAVGGVNITIENSFYDYWHKISFSEGTEKMNGERALAYARARYVEGPEGGDFKRAARQQQILLALREKVFSINTAFDFSAVNTILTSLSNNIRTDMQLWEMKRFFELARLIDQNKTHSVVLTTGPNGVLVGGTEVLGGVPASILRPRTGDYSEIRSIAANIFSEDVSQTITPTHSNAPDAEPATASTESTEEAKTTPEPEEKKEPTTVEVRNGTSVNGLAKKTSDELTAEGYEVLAIGNAVGRSVEKTTVYATQVTGSDAATEIANFLEAASSSTVPDDEPKTEADVLIILGADAAE